MIELKKDGLELVLSEPGTYYQGTRFDWAGVFRRITYDGCIYADEWFDTEDPLRHDNVCGPSEEFFGVIPLSGGWLKPGVGILSRPDGAPYDWFHTYVVADPGVRETRPGADSVGFVHHMEGCYDYSKTVRIGERGCFSISHSLKNLSGGCLPLLQYNHNFFNFGLPGVGAGRRVVFPAPFVGQWREGSAGAEQRGDALVITEDMLPGRPAYMGDIHVSGPEAEGGYAFRLVSEDGRSVHVSCDRPMHHAVMWSGHRVMCLEPFVCLDVAPDSEAAWTVSYRLG